MDEERREQDDVQEALRRIERLEEENQRLRWAEEQRRREEGKRRAQEEARRREEAAERERRECEERELREQEQQRVARLERENQRRSQEQAAERERAEKERQLKDEGRKADVGCLIAITVFLLLGFVFFNFVVDDDTCVLRDSETHEVVKEVPCP